jgi:hypothetical protein
LVKADPQSPKLWRRIISRPLRLFSHHAIGFGLCFGATGNERHTSSRIMADASRSRATAYTTFSAHKPGHALDHRWRDGRQCDNNEPNAYAEKSGTRRDRRDGGAGNVSSGIRRDLA